MHIRKKPKRKARPREDSSRAGGACTLESRFIHRKVELSPEAIIFITICRGGYYPPARHRLAMEKAKNSPARNPRGGGGVESNYIVNPIILKV